MIPWRVCLKSPYFRTEVAPGKPEVCHPGEEMYCHVSQAALGPCSNGKSERVVLRVETGGKDVVLGTLSSGKCDQMALDLIFDREFKLSHTGAACSVYFCGYKTEKGEPEEYGSEMEDEEESDDEEVPEAVPMKANGDAKMSLGKAAAESEKKKSSKSPGKPQLVDDEADEDDDDDSDDSDDDEDEFTQMNSTVMDFDSDDDSGEDDSEFEGDELDDSDDDEDDESDEDEDDSDDEDESDDEEMASPELGKKRPLKGDNTKSPAGFKKARMDTPAKPGLVASPGKKSEKSAAKAAAAAALSTPATATPSKKAKEGKNVKESKKEEKSPQNTPGKEVAVKTPKTAPKSGAKLAGTPNSDSAKKLSGAHKCEACKRSFATEAGASQHMVAKHGTAAK